MRKRFCPTTDIIPWGRGPKYGQGAIHASAEADDGVASALPSPLPSQGEPVAWRVRVPGLETHDWTLTYAPDRYNDAWEKQPLYTAEALAAAEARADSLKRERDDAVAKLKALAVEDYKAGQDMAKSAEVEIAELRARADRAEEDVLDRLYAKAAEESLLCASVVFREDAARSAAWLAENGAMLPTQRAGLRARTILKETPHDER